MKPQEVIKTLELAKAEVEWEYTLEYAIAIDEAIKAVEMQIPKKPNHIEAKDKYGICLSYECPNCKNPYNILYIGENHCKNCGQKLRWSDDE